MARVARVRLPGPTLTRLDLDTIEAELITTYADWVDAGPFGTYTLFWSDHRVRISVPEAGQVGSA
jgi:hypothetical protein